MKIISHRIYQILLSGFISSSNSSTYNICASLVYLLVRNLRWFFFFFNLFNRKILLNEQKVASASRKKQINMIRTSTNTWAMKVRPINFQITNCVHLTQQYWTIDQGSKFFVFFLHSKCRICKQNHININITLLKVEFQQKNNRMGKTKRNQIQTSHHKTKWQLKCNLNENTCALPRANVGISTFPPPEIHLWT